MPAPGRSRQRASKERMEGNLDVGLDEQREEKELAELKVTEPRIAWPILLEGSDVDEDGSNADELDVVRGGVLAADVNRGASRS